VDKGYRYNPEDKYLTLVNKGSCFDFYVYSDVNTLLVVALNNCMHVCTLLCC